MIHELGDWVKENDWEIESKEIDEHMSLALAAERSKNYSEAIRRYTRVIALTMDEVLRAQGEKPGDSDIVY